MNKRTTGWIIYWIFLILISLMWYWLFFSDFFENLENEARCKVIEWYYFQETKECFLEKNWSFLNQKEVFDYIFDLKQKEINSRKNKFLKNILNSNN